ncbi:MAG: DEAD/DEAH box helicase [Fermentimonas sp.]|nr:DEAD/DEAH box helicase [Fermentimonas sp.]
MLFTELPLTDSLLEGLDVMNFKEATPVQEQAIPIILNKKDVIACAQTGTGKTAAFLLPLLNNLQTDKHNENKVNAIIMAPTRELAQQIDSMMEGFSYYTPFSSVAVYGGNDGDAWDIQKKGLTSGADVVIATPGRLLSHINLYNIDFSGVKYFILDEADRMLDMGFFDDIMKIEKLLPKERQTVMFSATMPPKIQQLAKTILRNPEEISIAIARPPESIIQSTYICYEPQKLQILKKLFHEKKPNKVILFSGSKQKVKDIAKTLHQMKLSVGEMHSDLDQAQREHIMHEFKNERVDILVATDIVARGIDIDDITLVINFDVPYDVEDYIHRIGRTARAGDSGMAITFVAPEEQYRFEQIEEFLQKKIYRIPVPTEFGGVPEYNPSKNKRQRGSIASASKRRKSSKGTVDTNESSPNKGEGPNKKRTQKPRNNRTEIKNKPDNLNPDGENTKLDGLTNTDKAKKSQKKRKPKTQQDVATDNITSKDNKTSAENKPRIDKKHRTNKITKEENKPLNEQKNKNNQKSNKKNNLVQENNTLGSKKTNDSTPKKVVKKKLVKKQDLVDNVSSSEKKVKQNALDNNATKKKKSFWDWLPFGKK